MDICIIQILTLDNSSSPPDTLLMGTYAGVGLVVCLTIGIVAGIIYKRFRNRGKWYSISYNNNDVNVIITTHFRLYVWTLSSISSSFINCIYATRNRIVIYLFHFTVMFLLLTIIQSNVCTLSRIFRKRRHPRTCRVNTLFVF